MKATIAMLTLLFALSGCTRESPPGGPGVGNGEDGGTSKIKTEEATFRLLAPSTLTRVPQGEKEKVRVSLSRGEAFKESVELKFKLPRGITVIPETATLKQGEDETTVTLDVADDAPAGEHEVEVTGTPAVGKATSVHFHVEVTEKDEKNQGEKKNEKKDADL